MHFDPIQGINWRKGKILFYRGKVSQREAKTSFGFITSIRRKDRITCSLKETRAEVMMLKFRNGCALLDRFELNFPAADKQDSRWFSGWKPERVAEFAQAREARPSERRVLRNASLISNEVSQTANAARTGPGWNCLSSTSKTQDCKQA